MNAATLAVTLLAVVTGIGINIMLYLFLSYKLFVLDEQLRQLTDALRQSYYDGPEPDDGASQPVPEVTLKLVSGR